MTRKKLTEISDIQWWIHVRWSGNWNTISLLMRHFDQFWDLTANPEATISLSDKRVKHILKSNDILLWIKGSRFISCLFTEHNTPCIASTSFIVLRITEDALLPKYLAIYMNEALQWSYFKNRTISTTIPSIPKKVIANFEITIPPLEVQRKKIQIYDELKKQMKIYHSIVEHKSKLVHWLILS